MSITCQATSATQEPLQGMLVSLECLNDPRCSFEALTDEEGRITTWYSPGEDRDFNGSFSHLVQSVQSVQSDEWRLRFEIYRFAPAGSAILSIPVTFRINRELQRDIQLCLDASLQSYFVFIKDSPLRCETRVATVDPLYDPATSHNSAPRPGPAQADVDEMWPSELISDAYTFSPTQNPGSGASSSRTSESTTRSTWVDIHSSALKSDETTGNKQEEFLREDLRRLLSWSPPIATPQTDDAAGENGPGMKRKAVDIAASTDDSQAPPERPVKRPRTNGTRRSQRLRLRQMEENGDYIPLE